MASNLRDYLRIKEAAELLGVTPTTLRNWERRGKLRPRRHPINRYRLDARAELEHLLQQIERPPEDPDTAPGLVAQRSPEGTCESREERDEGSAG